MFSCRTPAVTESLSLHVLFADNVVISLTGALIHFPAVAQAGISALETCGEWLLATCLLSEMPEPNDISFNAGISACERACEHKVL